MSVNKGGSDCPTALKLVAVQVLLEITAFLRETYSSLPKSTRYVSLQIIIVLLGTGKLLIDFKRRIYHILQIINTILRN